jgi:Tfp pilus assembly protein PilF
LGGVIGEGPALKNTDDKMWSNRDDVDNRPDVEPALAQAQEYFQQAYEQQMNGNLEAAIELYRRSIEIHPTAEAHTFLGWSYSFQGRIDEAIEECHKAIAVDPDFGNPYNDIGAYLIQKGMLDEAIPWLQKATVAKRYEARAYPHINLGRIWERKGRVWDAMREYRTALVESPKYDEAYKALKRLESRLN